MTTRSKINFWHLEIVHARSMGKPSRSDTLNFCVNAQRRTSAGFHTENFGEGGELSSWGGGGGRASPPNVPASPKKISRMKFPQCN